MWAVNCRGASSLWHCGVADGWLPLLECHCHLAWNQEATHIRCCYIFSPKDRLAVSLAKCHLLLTPTSSHSPEMWCSWVTYTGILGGYWGNGFCETCLFKVLFWCPEKCLFYPPLEFNSTNNYWMITILKIFCCEYDKNEDARWQEALVSMGTQTHTS